MIIPPRENSIFVGHRKVVQELSLSWQSKRLHHAWLFAGPRGVGKATLAFRFARFLLEGSYEGLQNSFYLSPDHPVYRRVASGGHSDIKVIDSSACDRSGQIKTNIVVDDIRAIKRVLTLTPGEGEWRIIVIDGAEEMNKSAGNALLKFLEEPPPQSIFILICHSPGRLLPTIVSRCRRLNFRPVSDKQLKDLIKSNIAPGLTNSEVEVLAHLSEGSPGRAATLIECNGLEIYSRINGIISEFPHLDIKAVHALANECVKKDLGQVSFHTISELLTWSLSKLIREVASDELSKHGMSKENESWQGLMRRGNLESWANVWEELRRLFSDAEHSSLEPKAVIIKAFTTLQQAATS